MPGTFIRTDKQPLFLLIITANIWRWTRHRTMPLTYILKDSSPQFYTGGSIESNLQMRKLRYTGVEQRAKGRAVKKTCRPRFDPNRRFWTNTLCSSVAGQYCITLLRPHCYFALKWFLWLSLCSESRVGRCLSTCVTSPVLSGPPHAGWAVAPWGWHSHQ